MAAFILICALGLAAPACQPDTALDVLRAPAEGINNPFTCLREAEAYFAALDYPMPANSYTKFACMRSQPPSNVG